MIPKILRKILKLKAENVKIGQKIIGYDYPLYFIAEAGVNHNGDINLALKMIETAKIAGAQAIKFQTFKADQVCLSELKTSPYQKKNTGLNKQFMLLKKLELKDKDYPVLQKAAKKLGLDFLSTPHGHLNSVKFLQKIDIPAFKIASSDITDTPLLTAIAKIKRPAILSTGQSNLKEIKEAVKIFDQHNCPLVILHCVSNYPTEIKEANLAAMIDLYKNFPDKLIGYSDHTIQQEALITATSLGANVIETHFTLDRKLPGPDQKASFEPKDFKIAIDSIRKTEKILGDGFKIPAKSELIYLLDDRRSITSLLSLKKGEIFTENNLITRRPERNGLKPKYWSQIIGKKATKNISANTQIKKGDWY